MVGIAKQRNRRLVRTAAFVFLAIVLFVVWYAVAANYDYGALAGIYVLDQNTERCLLALHSDGTFTEELVYPGEFRERQVLGIDTGKLMFPSRINF
jgi:hypothetical protein